MRGLGPSVPHLLSAPSILAIKQKTLEASRKQSKLQEMKRKRLPVPENHWELLAASGSAVAATATPKLALLGAPLRDLVTPSGFQIKRCEPTRQEGRPVGGGTHYLQYREDETQTQHPQQGCKTPCSLLGGTSVHTLSSQRTHSTSCGAPGPSKAAVE